MNIYGVKSSSECYSVSSFMDDMNAGRLSKEKIMEKCEMIDCVSIRRMSEPEICENYGNSKMKMLGSQGIPGAAKNKLFYEVQTIMKNYYSGQIDKEDLKEKIAEYVTSYAGVSMGKDDHYSKVRTSTVISDVYEYFSRVNTRAAVHLNQEEASDFWTECGVKHKGMDSYSASKGTVYYNAKYYYKCEEIQNFFQDTLDELAEQFGVTKTDYDAIAKNTQFSLDGGLTFNGVWNWQQYQTNHYWMKLENSTYIIDNNFVPPNDFVYAYTNNVDQDNAKGILNYMKGKDNADVVDSKSEMLLMELRYGREISWGQDSKIKDFLNEKGWNFLIPSKGYFQENIFRMVLVA